MSKKKILVTGANGQLGMELRAIAGFHSDYDFFFASRAELPIENLQTVKQFFEQQHLDFCINCAAYTAVDRAETERDQAMNINAVAVGHLAAICKKQRIQFIHISTDYVFPGTANKPYSEKDNTEPVNYYGFTKLEGERLAIKNNPASLIIRTSWVYSEFGKNFVKTMLRLMGERESIGVVADQFGSPTYAADLAAAIMTIVTAEHFVSGIFQYCNKGVISWHEFATAIEELLGSNCTVNAINTYDYPTPAARPHYSALDTSKIEATYSLQIPNWKESLKICLLKIEANS